MEFNFKMLNDVPALAWCLYASKGDAHIRVFHGKNVETSKDEFSEGAWDGCFNEKAFANSTAFMGSGGIIIGRHLILATPSHCLEKIFLLRRGNELFASNSLIFLLVAANEQLIDDYWQYTLNMLSIMNGLRRCVKHIPISRGLSVRLFYYTNIEIDDELNLSEKPKVDPPHFQHYEDFHRYLSYTVKAIGENASDTTRKIRYSPISTISSGYDGSVCSIFSKSIGGKEALSIRQSRGFDNRSRFPLDLLDHGQAIGESLKIKVKLFERKRYLELDCFPEAEFLSCGTLGDDVIFASFQEHLENHLLLTGFYGSLWRKDFTRFDDVYIYSPPCGCSLTEFRLRKGFLHLPVPFLGAVRYRDLNKISNSDEMSQWSIGGDYDRPIARRIIEEAGVERGLFARRKKGASVIFWSEGLKQCMTEHSYSDYLSFLSRSTNVQVVTIRRMIEHIFKFLHTKQLRKTYLHPMMENVLSLISPSLHEAHRDLAWASTPGVVPYFFPFGTLPFLFHWGVEKTKKRYTSIEGEI